MIEIKGGDFFGWYSIIIYNITNGYLSDTYDYEYIYI
jgi:hypothetical protein